ncbi:C-type lectin domain family 12 member B-like [Platysternon megacephalum]|uniref:Transmembrane channel-like protein n=1 Tax=Platysternon megacephalum TaxID=55544 RepID=A0A4D9DR54_9SAUR|nr:C-type lectin domain family 12 member B-like [Platysternon megacephalum]
MLISAYWHGLHPGYYLSFLTIPLCLAAEGAMEAGLRGRRGAAPEPDRSWGAWVHWFLKMRAYDYMCMGFVLLELGATLRYWRSVYFCVWRGSLHHIEGYFGTGIQSYFNFLRFLVLLNLGGALLTVGFVVAPNAAFEGLRLNQTQQGPNSTVISNCLQYDPTKHGLVSYFTYLMDLLSGTLTYLFYGYYQNSAVDFVGFSYNIPLAYLLSVLGYFSVCLLWIVHRLVSENGALNSYSNKVFAGWDFCLGPGTAVHMKHNSLRYELRMDLEEQTLRRLMAQRSPAQRLALYSLRGVLNLLVLALLGAAFYCVYRATDVGREMYKLLVFDLLVVLLVLLLVEFPRKLLVTHGPAPLARLWGQQEFLVPPNVLDLVYGQTVCWVGAAFSPLLPLLNTANSSFFFLLVLLLGLAIAWVPLLYSVFVLQPSQACGPFRGEPTMWSTLWAAIDTLPHVAREFLQFVGSLAFAVPLFLLLCILMFYLMALAHSYSRLVKELKGQLRLEGRDKVFLVTQITELS